MYSQYTRGCNVRDRERLTAAPTNPRPRQLLKSELWRNGPPKTKIQLRRALTNKNATLFHMAGRGSPTD
jgi:hypothetical protein